MPGLVMRILVRPGEAVTGGGAGGARSDENGERASGHGPGGGADLSQAGQAVEKGPVLVEFDAAPLTQPSDRAIL